MSTVTYKHQPAIHKTRGTIPLAGTSHLYTVTKLLWPPEIEQVLLQECHGLTLHVCCGKSQLGNVRLDLYEPEVDICADAARLPFEDESFTTVLCDPPYNGKFQWNHDMLSELFRVAKYRVIFQHWYSPVNKNGHCKKANRFILTALYNWMPKSYFGRMQIISIFDNENYMEVK